MAENREGSLLGNLLFTRYLKETDHLANALQSSEVRKFRNTAHLFQRYANRYNFDWLMIMSQAYQESRLDNSLVSNAGRRWDHAAVAEHSGGQERQHRRDRETGEQHTRRQQIPALHPRPLFEDEAMDDLNKTLFSFAAYNAGPARIAGLRKAAAAKGLDPNVWFDNVEVLAAQRVGREPVDYVRNIYKYWIAYQLSREQLDAAVKPLETA